MTITSHADRRHVLYIRGFRIDPDLAPQRHAGRIVTPSENAPVIACSVAVPDNHKIARVVHGHIGTSLIKEKRRIDLERAAL